MDGEELFLVFSMFVVFPSAVGFGVAWLSARRELRRVQREREADRAAFERRFDVLEQAVDAMAIHMDRLTRDVEAGVHLPRSEAPPRLPPPQSMPPR